MYYPIYHFKVDDIEYTCKSKTGSSSAPKERKNKVYYDSKNPENCLTQYEKSSSKTAGIICLVVTGILVFVAFKKPSDNQTDNYNINDSINYENIEKVEEVVNKIQLISKKIIIGILIAILFILIIFDSFIVFQTIKAKDYIETTAVLVSKKEENDSEVFDDYIYSFEDKKGNNQEITISISKDSSAQEKLKIKYNENNPSDYYEETALLDKSGTVWYIVKIVALILLIILFFNNKLLNKINLSIGR